MSIRRILGGGLICAFLTLSSFGGTLNGGNKPYWILADETVAVVNNEPILYTDVKLYQLLFNDPSFEDALNKVITINVVAQYALQQGLDIPSSKLSEIVQKFAKSQGLTVEQLYKILQERGLGGLVFQNFIYKYNLYVGAVQVFVLQPLLKNKAELENLIALYSKKAQPYYKLEILKIPLKVAEENTDLLVSLDFQKISKKLGIKPITITAKPNELSPSIAKVVKRLRKGQTDFAQENGYIYLIKVLNVEYKISPEDRKRILAKIEEEKINEFIKNLKNEAVIKILDKSPKIYLPKGY